jgi:hypothetical protein
MGNRASPLNFVHLMVGMCSCDHKELEVWATATHGIDTSPNFEILLTPRK